MGAWGASGAFFPVRSAGKGDRAWLSVVGCMSGASVVGGPSPGTLTLELPVQRPMVEVPVVELFLNG